LAARNKNYKRQGNVEKVQDLVGNFWQRCADSFGQRLRFQGQLVCEHMKENGAQPEFPVKIVKLKG